MMRRPHDRFRGGYNLREFNSYPGSYHKHPSFPRKRESMTRRTPCASNSK
jgi:hypothetical protein